MGAKDGAAYGLGVSIGIAECQARVGEPARAIVASSLQQAQAFGNSLVTQGVPLNISHLTDILNDVNAGRPIDQIYNRLLALRGEYQGAIQNAP